MTRYIIFTEDEIKRLSEHAPVSEWDFEGNQTVYISEEGYRALTEPADPTTPLS